MRRSLLSGIMCACMSLAGATAAAAATPATVDPATCSRYAAPTGSDTAAGTLAAPLRTVKKLVDTLVAGQVGCLRGGTYGGDVAIARSAITLTAYAGEQATVVGRFWIKDGANDVLVTGLNLNGKNSDLLPSPTVNGDRARFVGNDVTNSNTGICFIVGSSGWGRAQGTVIQGNRIHDCGRLPSTNHDHGIYVSDADDTQIVDNVIFRNADRGIQLYPDAQRTLIRGNVIDGNGEGIIFSGAGGDASNGNLVESNLLTNATIRTNVESWYPSGNPIGVDNVVRVNCLANGAGGTIGTQEGFTATNNLVVSDPKYLARTSGDFRLASDSPCAATIAGSRAPAGPSWEAPVEGTVLAPAPTSSKSAAPVKKSKKLAAASRVSKKGFRSTAVGRKRFHRCMVRHRDSHRRRVVRKAMCVRRAERAVGVHRHRLRIAGRTDRSRTADRAGRRSV